MTSLREAKGTFELTAAVTPGTAMAPQNAGISIDSAD